ncbi:MAG: class I SAM-dependent methyltransferase [Actinomycetota bacterium]
MRATAGQARASADWLALREPADAAARSPELVEEIRSPFPVTGEAVVHDLGCGTGSMGRWLAAQLTGRQHWVLHDRDAELLAVAAAHPPDLAADGAPVTVETRCHDITRLGPAELTGAALVTASALLDTMTAADLERFVATCAAAGCPVLVTLTVTGRVELTPADALDRRVAAAFNAHQQRTAGTGTLLGPRAVRAAVDGFTRRGFDVRVRASPWRLGPGQAALAAEWFSGWLAAACEQQPEMRAESSSYARRRLAEAAAGRLRVTVDHRDLLALPR